jgi:ABC-type multidrug transport system fused ATPase/permease subunit
MCSRYQKRTARFAQDSIASANEVAEEAFSLLRVVRTFGTEKEEVGRSILHLVRLTCCLVVFWEFPWISSNNGAKLSRGVEQV